MSDTTVKEQHATPAAYRGVEGAALGAGAESLAPAAAAGPGDVDPPPEGPPESPAEAPMPEEPLPALDAAGVEDDARENAGIALRGTAVEGIAVRGIAADGMAVRGIAVDGIAL